jgi:hypothetical protein
MRRITALSFSFFLFLSLNGQHKDLDFYLTTGLTNSPLLKDYNNRIKSTVIDSMRIKAGQGVMINASGVSAYAPVINGWGEDEVKTDIADLRALVQVSREINWNRNLQNRYQAVNLQNQMSLLEGKLSARDLKKNIITQYILTYGDQQYFELNREVLDMLRQEELIVKKLAENGYYRQTEYLAFTVNIRQQELITEKYNFTLRSDFETLNYLCGIFDTTFYSLASPFLIRAHFATISNSVFYRQFIIDSLKLANSDRQIDFNYQPKLSLFADGGYLSSLNVTPWKNFGISAGLSLTVPVYDGKQKQMQHDQVAISELTRSNYRDFFSVQYRQKVVMLENQIEALERISDKTIEQQKYVRALIDANLILLNNGDIPVSEYLLSVNNYLNVNLMLIDNTIERFSILNELNYWIEK